MHEQQQQQIMMEERKDFHLINLFYLFSSLLPQNSTTLDIHFRLMLSLHLNWVCVISQRKERERKKDERRKIKRIKIAINWRGWERESEMEENYSREDKLQLLNFMQLSLSRYRTIFLFLFFRYSFSIDFFVVRCRGWEPGSFKKNLNFLKIPKILPKLRKFEFPRLVIWALREIEFFLQV